VSPTSTDGAGRTTRPALSRALIVSTALELLDRDGPEKLTMRRLGAQLGADPMAVYHYFPSKAALFDAVVEAVYADLEPPEPDPGATWREDVTAYAVALRRALLRHPGALPAVSTRPVSSALVLDLHERFVARLVDGGIDAATAVDVMTGIAVFTIGQALAEVGEPVGGDDGGAELPDLSRYPTLLAAIEQGWSSDFDKQFHLVLEIMLDGVERRVGRG
jgi:AcrR family transcriptional regulator